MKILYISRNPKMGFSIGKVFSSIIGKMKEKADVDSIELPRWNYHPKNLLTNIKAARDAVRKKEYDIVHITGTEHYLIPFLRGQHVVVTVHDLGFFTNKRLTPRTFGKYLLWIYSLKFADYVTFISDKSEEEALRLVHLSDDKHSVVFNPVGADFHYVPKAINTERPVILHIGTNANKNLHTTAVALKGYPCKLRIVGKLNDETKALLDQYKIDYEAVHDLTDEELLQEYIHCDFVNFPSLYEGFGMPIIEAQSVGRLVLTSNISPMKEVAGDGAVTVDPTNAEEIRKGYEYMRGHAEELVRKGLENVKRFQLEDITNEYYQIYEKMLQG